LFLFLILQENLKKLTRMKNKQIKGKLCDFFHLKYATFFPFYLHKVVNESKLKYLYHFFWNFFHWKNATERVRKIRVSKRNSCISYTLLYFYYLHKFYINQSWSIHNIFCFCIILSSFSLVYQQREWRERKIITNENEESDSLEWERK
jgi:hypothetical protein